MRKAQCEDRQAQIPGTLRPGKYEHRQALPAQAPDLYESLRQKRASAFRLFQDPACPDHRAFR